MGTYGDRFNDAVAAELRAQRARVNVTVAEMQEATGFAKTTVLNYLNGKRAIPAPALMELARSVKSSAKAIVDAAEDSL